MSYNAGQIMVTFATIAEASQNVNRTYANLDQKLNDLKQMLQPIVANWTGTAAEAYQQKQQAWDTAQNDLGAVLSQIGQVLEAAHESYTTTESANTRTWQ
jgi:WXG100 family type VII secretion target